ncbi:AraC family transcriptional regulator [Kaistia sp. 32K]|uniref:GlxA family transcriptional regulator n=1 Tax=Kaistia sp. 32K TaxID=2795690 RepID=UPI0019157123|nr:GlxA family transcriptional regulator [Kaistia sp. 32K]BCP52334.1 AraC family transcriptional regulator [Kaistia sp. 32K]
MRTIGIVLSPNFQLLSLSVMTGFEIANTLRGEREYELRYLSEHGGPVVSSTSLPVVTEAFSGSYCDTLIVPGGMAPEKASPGLLAYLREAATISRRVAATCMGAFIVAEAGLLDGKRATTHWAFARAFQKEYPAIKVEEDRIFITQGNIWTSAGMTAGLDLALALIEQDLGSDLSKAVAKNLVVHHRRSGGQSQFSALLELSPKSDRIQTALMYARTHLRNELSVEELADAARLSPRQFSRLFSAETGQSPAKAVELLRLEAARDMIERGSHAIETVVREAGFGDRERMRRAFLRVYGQPPQVVRRQAQLSREDVV